MAIQVKNPTIIMSGGSNASIFKKGGYVGEPIISDGVTNIEKIYYNTNLSLDEVVERISKLSYFTYNSEMQIYIVSSNSGCTNTFGIIIQGGAYVIVCGDFANDNLQYLFLSQDIGAGFVGWNPTINGSYDFNAVSGKQLTLDGKNYVPVGRQNESIYDLFSTIPIVSEDDKTIELSGTYTGEKENVVLPIYNGTPVPVDGVTTVEKIYFNTELSIEEVRLILESIPFTFVNTSTVLYSPFAIESGNSDKTIIIMGSYAEDFLNKQQYEWSIVTNNGKEIFSTYKKNSKTGWSEKEIEINGISKTFDEVNNLSIGNFNNLLSNLISTTPFTKKTGLNVENIIKEQKFPLEIDFKQIKKDVYYLPLVGMCQFDSLENVDIAEIPSSVEFTINGTLPQLYRIGIDAVNAKLFKPEPIDFNLTKVKVQLVGKILYWELQNDDSQGGMPYFYCFKMDDVGVKAPMFAVITYYKNDYFNFNIPITKKDVSIPIEYHLYYGIRTDYLQLCNLNYCLARIGGSTLTDFTSNPQNISGSLSYGFSLYNPDDPDYLPTNLGALLFKE